MMRGHSPLPLSYICSCIKCEGLLAVTGCLNRTLSGFVLSNFQENRDCNSSFAAQGAKLPYGNDKTSPKSVLCPLITHSKKGFKRRKWKRPGSLLAIVWPSVRLHLRELMHAVRFSMILNMSATRVERSNYGKREGNHTFILPLLG